jgi:hypothetical protein
MTVEEHGVIDFIGVEPNGSVVLTISDHLPWDEVKQQKINAYPRFIESGEIYEKYPDHRGRPVVISVALKCVAPDEAQWFFKKSTTAIERAGFQSQVRQIAY